MTTLTIRPYVGEDQCYSLAVSDRGVNSAKLFADIADLVKLNDAIAQLDDDTLACDLPRLFDAPDVDRARDLRVWQDSRGKLIGFGQLLISEQKDEIEGYLYFDIHPAWRSDTLGNEILQWSEQRMREVGRERNVPLKLLTYCRNDRFDRLILLEKQGFTIERSFLTMACSLNQPIPSPSLPSGLTLQPLSHLPLCAIAFCDRELNAWVELFNESFIDHWNHHDLTVETARHWLFDNPHCKPELNLIAIAPDGTFAALCVGYINQEENAHTGRNEGWIKLLGTRRGFRKRGLGRAMLLAQMRQFKAAGVEQVKLGVDAQSLTSATRLYQSVGFQPIKTWLSYVFEIQ
jgi:GNAT superfamily N-acetyltransferase